MKEYLVETPYGSEKIEFNNLKRWWESGQMKIKLEVGVIGITDRLQRDIYLEVNSETIRMNYQLWEEFLIEFRNSKISDILG
jgi:hypothetical protein